MPGTHPLDLSGRRVRLCEFAADDLDAVVAVVGDDRVTTFLSFDSRTRVQAEAMLAGVLERARHEPRTEFYLAVEALSGPPLVEFVRLAFSGVRAAKVGSAIHADHWGNGYATDALRPTPQPSGLSTSPRRSSVSASGCRQPDASRNGSGMIGR